MHQDHPAIVWCRNQRNSYCRLLADLEAGKFKIGRVLEKDVLEDTTAEQIQLIEQKLIEMDALLARPFSL